VLVFVRTTDRETTVKNVLAQGFVNTPDVEISAEIVVGQPFVNTGDVGTVVKNAVVLL
jgi:hypothetical protein